MGFFGVHSGKPANKKIMEVRSRGGQGSEIGRHFGLTYDAVAKPQRKSLGRDMLSMLVVLLLLDSGLGAG